jgi:hypothetical protein
MPHCACLRGTALRIKACLDAHLYAMYFIRLSALCMSAEMKMVRHADFNPILLSKVCMHSHISKHVSSRSLEGLVQWMPVHKHNTASAAVFEAVSAGASLKLSWPWLHVMDQLQLSCHAVQR